MASHETLEALHNFVKERDWAQFHTVPNLAKSISIEAAELLELFQWNNTYDEIDLRSELADVLTYCYLLASRINANPDDLILEKLQITKEKYPAEKAHGRSDKYDQL